MKFKRRLTKTSRGISLFRFIAQPSYPTLFIAIIVCTFACASASMALVCGIWLGLIASMFIIFSFKGRNKYYIPCTVPAKIWTVIHWIFKFVAGFAMLVYCIILAVYPKRSILMGFFYQLIITFISCYIAMIAIRCILKRLSGKKRKQ